MPQFVVPDHSGTVKQFNKLHGVLKWVLASERVWNAGNRRAGQVMVITSLAGLVLTLAGASTWILLGLIVLAILILNIYSLVTYKRSQCEHNL